MVKELEFRDRIEVIKQDKDINGAVETKLTKEIEPHLIMFPGGYMIVKTEREDIKGGDSALLVKENLKFKELLVIMVFSHSI